MQHLSMPGFFITQYVLRIERYVDCVEQSHHVSVSMAMIHADRNLYNGYDDIGLTSNSLGF